METQCPLPASADSPVGYDLAVAKIRFAPGILDHFESQLASVDQQSELEHLPQRIIR